MRLRAAFLSLFAALVLLAGPAIGAASLPALTGRVVDDAHLIDPATRQAIEQKLADYEKKSSDQVVVATIDSLGGEAIEPYANRLFRFWKLGEAKENNGVLLLVAKNDRKMRIEVGYGLEGTLTDLQSKLIIENDLVPAFRAGDFSGGISKAVDDIVAALSGNPAELQARAARNEHTRHNGPNFAGILFFIIWGSVFFFGLGSSLLAPIFGRRIGRNRYRWLGMNILVGGSGYSGGGWSSGGGFSGGGGSSGGGGASGSW
ncbi:MAG: YgcG family protein [Rhizobiaceae bacterium]|nr:MAG: YgcG family protein [Rhizobiaceae bacterium]